MSVTLRRTECNVSYFRRSERLTSFNHQYPEDGQMLRFLTGFAEIRSVPDVVAQLRCDLNRHRANLMRVNDCLGSASRLPSLVMSVIASSANITAAPARSCSWPPTPYGRHTVNPRKRSCLGPCAIPADCP